MKNIKIVLLGVFILSLTSCLKEARMNIDPSYASNVIELANTGDNFTSSGIPGYYADLGSVKAGASKSFNVNVHYTGPGNAPSDITVTIGIDEATLATYNAKNGTSKVTPPTEAYAFPTQVVIKKGTNQTTVQAVITVSSNFNFSKAYALPIKITAVSTGVISGNYASSVYAFGVRNEYDGVYNYKGYALRAGDAVLTGYFRNKRMNLLTIGANAVQFGSYALWGDGAGGIGIGYPTMTIDVAAGSGGVYPVTFASSGGAYNAPGYNVRYEAASKTFFVAATWGAGPSARLLVDTLTYMNPR